jgi:DNA-binding transcriptional MerR regulator
VTGLRIAQLAERTGFSASTLRYYERVGLLEPPVRTAAGYRMYDEAAVDRLAFVDRAKRMGFALDEISELVRLWAAGECPPVQHRMRALIDARRRDVRGQVAEMTAFAGQLDEVAARLDDAGEADRCGPGCGCEVTVAAGRVHPLPMPARRTPPPAIACSLDAGALTQRLADWRAVGAQAQAVTPTATGVRARFPLAAELTASVARLVALEVGCCPFLTMTLSAADGALDLRIDAPTGAEDLARELLSPASNPA